MSLSRRVRNIAKTQINALKEHMERVDREYEDSVLEKRAERDAREELSDPADLRPARRSPEEIATGRATRSTSSVPASITPVAAASPLAVHYRILGLEDGADLSSVEAAYNKLVARCAPDRFPEADERQAAEEIFKRVDAAYTALRDALDPTAGRFDKLEL